METQRGICGLCLKICDNCKAVDGDINDVLVRVLSKIDLTAIQELVMCTCCTEILIEYFDFKTTCCDTYSYIVPFISNKEGVKLNLRDIYLSKNENCTFVPQDQIICGLCMGPVQNCSAISLDVENIMLERMIKQCLPELDLSIIEKPVVCASCHVILEKCFHFVMNCLFVEENIKKYCETLDMSSRGQIELSSLLQFTTRETKGNSFETIKVEKEFCQERENYNERKIDNAGDMLKLEPIFYANSENDNEGDSNKFGEIDIMEAFCKGENKTHFKEENLFEMENQTVLVKEEIEIKTDDHDFNGLKDGVVSPQPKSTRLYRRQGCLMPKLEEDLSCINHALKRQNKSSEMPMYQCSSCPFETKHKRNLRRHSLVHKCVTMYKCDYCLFQAKSIRHLKKHELVHKDPSEVTMYKCNTCPFQTKRKDCLKTHLLMHQHPSQIPMYKCNLCLFQTKYKFYLKTHLLTHVDPSETTVFKCVSCSFQAKDKSQFKRHLLVHKHILEVAIYNCDICSYQTKRKSQLKRHLLVHKHISEVTMYNCDICSYQTKRKNALKNHQLIHKNSSETTMYKCDICSFQTKHKVCLKKHSVVHKHSSEVNMYNCDTCSYQTKFKASLFNHLLVHKDSSEVIMHKCDICSFQTKYKQHLKDHLQGHKDPSEVKMHSCDTCSYQAKRKYNLKIHMLRHMSPSEVTMYSCDTCSYQTKYKKGLTKHMLLHKSLSEAVPALKTLEVSGSTAVKSEPVE